MWVSIDELRAIDACGAAEVMTEAQAKRGGVVRATFDAEGEPVKAARGASGTTAFVPEYMVAKVRQFEERPGHRVYEYDGQTFVPDVVLQGLGVPAQAIAEAAAAGYWYEVMNARFVRGELKPCKPEDCRHVLLAISYAMRAFPGERDDLLSNLFPGETQSRCPRYSVAGTAEGSTWVSTEDVRRAVPGAVGEGDDLETFSSMMKPSLKAANIRHVRQSRRGLETVIHPKAKDCYPFLRSEWVEETFGIRTDDANLTLPVAFGTHPPNKGTRGAPKASKAPGVVNPKQTSVKCTLSCRLVDKRARAIIEDIVDNVTKASRFASHLVNLHCIRLMDSTGGVLGDDFALDDDLLKRCARLAKVGATAKCAELAATMEVYGAALEASRFDYRDQGNATKADAQAYMGNVKATFAQAGPGRVATLLKSALTLYPCAVENAVYKLTRYVEGAAFPPGEYPEEVAKLATKYRKVYDSTSLHLGFHVPDGVAQQGKLRDVLMLYWQLNKDHLALERSALATGLWSRRRANDDTDDVKVWNRQSFALLPVNSLKRRHVRICQDVFATKIYKKLFNMNVEGLEKEAFLTLFKAGGKRREDVRSLRSLDKGWVMGSSFVTDGTSVSVRYANLSKGETTAEKKLREKGLLAEDDLIADFKPADRKVGIDPGRVNIMATCERLETGDIEVKKFTRREYYAGKLGDLKERRERRHKRYEAAMAAISATRRRTSDGAEFAQYVAAIGANKADLEKAYAGRSACSESFESYSGKHKALDAFLRGLGSHPKDGTLYVGLGAGKFACTGPGEQSVPTTAVQRRMRTAFKERMKVLMVDEWMTTQRSCVYPHDKLGVPDRTLPGGGKTKDRDVRFCSSEFVLGSHPCPPPASLTEGLAKPAGTVWVCRDGNSAHCMMSLMGLRHEDRPEAFRRPTYPTPCMMGVVTSGSVQK
jgi:hypothetical protein